MPLAGILVQYTGWSSVFYVYGESLCQGLINKSCLNPSGIIYCQINQDYLLQLDRTNYQNYKKYRPDNSLNEDRFIDSCLCKT